MDQDEEEGKVCVIFLFFPHAGNHSGVRPSSPLTSQLDLIGRRRGRRMAFKERTNRQAETLLLLFVNQLCKRRLQSYITDGLTINYAHRDHVVFEDLFFFFFLSPKQLLQAGMKKFF